MVVCASKSHYRRALGAALVGCGVLACSPPGAGSVQNTSSTSDIPQVVHTPILSVLSATTQTPSLASQTPVSIPSAPPTLTVIERNTLGPAGALSPPIELTSLPMQVLVTPTPDIPLDGTQPLAGGFPSVAEDRPAPPPPPAPIGTVPPSSDSTEPNGARHPTPKATMPSPPPGPRHIVLPQTSDPPVAELVKKADLIVRGTVTQIDSTRWPTADGQRPQGYNSTANSDLYRIFRPVHLLVSDVYQGELAQKEVILHLPGGSVPEGSLAYADQTFNLRPGDDVVVFLAHQNILLGDETLWRIVGKFNVRDGIARQNQSERPIEQLVTDIRTEGDAERLTP